MKVVLSLVLVFLMSLVGTNALSCYCQKHLNCPEVETLKKTCKGGLTLDVCGCCEECAKVKGENCGGPWGIDGTCDEGLACDRGQYPKHHTIGVCTIKVSSAKPGVVRSTK